MANRKTRRIREKKVSASWVPCGDFSPCLKSPPCAVRGRPLSFQCSMRFLDIWASRPPLCLETREKKNQPAAYRSRLSYQPFAAPEPVIFNIQRLSFLCPSQVERRELGPYPVCGVTPEATVHLATPFDKVQHPKHVVVKGHPPGRWTPSMCSSGSTWSGQQSDRSTMSCRSRFSSGCRGFVKRFQRSLGTDLG